MTEWHTKDQRKAWFDYYMNYLSEHATLWHPGKTGKLIYNHKWLIDLCVLHDEFSNKETKLAFVENMISDINNDNTHIEYLLMDVFRVYRDTVKYKNHNHGALRGRARFCNNENDQTYKVGNTLGLLIANFLVRTPNLNLLDYEKGRYAQLLAWQVRYSTDPIQLLDAITFDNEIPEDRLIIIMENLAPEHRSNFLERCIPHFGNSNIFLELLTYLPEVNIIDWFVKMSKYPNVQPSIPSTLHRNIERLECSDSKKTKLHLGFRLLSNGLADKFELLKIDSDNINPVNCLASICSGIDTILTSQFGISAQSDFLTTNQRQVLARINKTWGIEGMSSTQQSTKNNKLNAYTDVDTLIKDLESNFLSNNGRMRSFRLIRREQMPAKSESMLAITYLVHTLKHDVKHIFNAKLANSNNHTPGSLLARHSMTTFGRQQDSQVGVELSQIKRPGNP